MTAENLKEFRLSLLLFCSYPGQEVLITASHIVDTWYVLLAVRASLHMS